MVNDAGVGRSAAAGQRAVTGLGGWLILVMITLLLLSARSVFALLANIINYSYILLTTSLLSVPQTILFLADTALNFLFGFVSPLILLVLMFKRSARFPRLFTFWAIGNVAAIGVHIVMMYFITDIGVPVDTSRLVQQLMPEIVLAFLQAAIGVPYMRASRRVRDTFVR
jgi:hypothetical protein